jgi:hypothetical protein
VAAVCVAATLMAANAIQAIYLFPRYLGEKRLLSVCFWRGFAGLSSDDNTLRMAAYEAYEELLERERLQGRKFRRDGSHSNIHARSVSGPVDKMMAPVPSASVRRREKSRSFPACVGEGGT